MEAADAATPRGPPRIFINDLASIHSWFVALSTNGTLLSMSMWGSMTSLNLKPKKGLGNRSKTSNYMALQGTWLKFFCNFIEK